MFQSALFFNVLTVGVAVGIVAYQLYTMYNQSNHGYQEARRPEPGPNSWSPRPSTSGQESSGPRAIRMRSFPTEECTICFENIENCNSRELPCGHIFHRDCISKVDKKCPLCRRSFN